MYYVVLVERDELASGSTSRAAGGVRAQFSDELNIQLGARSLEVFARFGEEPGQDIGLRRVGYLFLLSTPEEVAAFEDGVRRQNALGVPSRLIDPAEAQRLSPLISTDGLLAAAFSPDDGHCTPESVFVQGYAACGPAGTARPCLRHREVTGIETRGERDHRGRHQPGADRHRHGCLRGRCLVSRAVGAMVGVDLPVEPLRRQIAVTEASGPAADLPMTIDFTTSLYFHSEGPGLLLGMSDPDEVPGFATTPHDRWIPRLSEAMERRAPALLDLRRTGGWGGPDQITPDHNALIGQARSCARFLYATGFSGHGFLQGPAVGEVIRDLVPGPRTLRRHQPPERRALHRRRPAPGGQPRMTELHLWLRHEIRTTERRTPIVPADARRLVESGVTLTVEESPQRVFPIEAYEEAGCRVAKAGSWVSAPPEAVIVGLEGLPDRTTRTDTSPCLLRHAYKLVVRGGGASSAGSSPGAGPCWTSSTWCTTTGAGSPRSATGPDTWAPPWRCCTTGAASRPRCDPPRRRTWTPNSPPRRASCQLSSSARSARSGRGARVALGVAGVEPTSWTRRDPGAGPTRAAGTRVDGQHRAHHPADPALPHSDEDLTSPAAGCAPCATSPATSGPPGTCCRSTTPRRTGRTPPAASASGPPST